MLFHKNMMMITNAHIISALVYNSYVHMMDDLFNTSAIDASCFGIITVMEQVSRIFLLKYLFNCYFLINLQIIAEFKETNYMRGCVE